MNDAIDRREALRRLALFSTATAVSGLLIACKSKPSCNDLTSLTPDEVRARNDTAGYVEHAPDPSKKCAGCMHYVTAPPNTCGGCKVMKGPIDPEASCKLWAPRPA